MCNTITNRKKVKIFDLSYDWQIYFDVIQEMLQINQCHIQFTQHVIIIMEEMYLIQKMKQKRIVIASNENQTVLKMSKMVNHQHVDC